MDLSKFSDSDLAALQQGDLSKVSDAGLNMLQANAPKQQKELSILGDMAAGALRGAGSIGATLLTPIDAGARAFGVENEYIGRRDRRQAMTDALRSMGANPESTAFGVGKVASEIAGTAGVGGALAKGASAIHALARTAPGLIQALRTSGMSGGNLLSRITGGAISGGAQAGLANPEDARTGAAIGASIPAVGAALRGAASLGKKFLGGTTGVGEEAISQAYKSGKEGGGSGAQFLKNMREGGAPDDVLTAAKQNLDAMRGQRQAAYRANMAGVTKDKTVLGFGDIDNALADASSSVQFKGQVKSPSAAKALQQVSDEVSAWRNLDPAEYHTPEGLDALKQRISDIQESIPVTEANARRVVGNVYNSVKSSIEKQAGDYSKAMKDYSNASETIKEIESSLSLKQKAAADTSMRKLQSLMRNNVNTSYGYRTKLAEQLEQAGGQQIMPQLAGQALSEWTPRGIQRATATGGSGALALTGNIPAAAGMAAISSPRLVGEAAYGLGKAAGAVDPRLIQALKQATYKAAPISAQPLFNE
jgi:hypothetical protein